MLKATLMTSADTLYKVMLAYMIMLSPLCTSTYGQADTTSQQVLQKYKSLDTREERLDYIDSIDLHRNFSTDSIFASLLYEVIDENLKAGDTASVIGMSISLNNYYFYPLSAPQKIVDLIGRFDDYIDNHPTHDVGGLLLGLADAYYGLGNLQKSYKVYKQAAQLYEEFGDSSYQNYGIAYLRAADNANLMGKYGKSVQDFEAAKNIFTYQKDTSLYLWASYGQSVNLSKLRFFEDADSLRKDILPTALEIKADDVVIAIYVAAMADSRKVGDYDESLKYARKLIKMCNQMPDSYQCMTAYMGIAVDYINKGNIDSASYYFKLYEDKMSKFKGNKTAETDYYILKANLAYAKGHSTQAQNIIDRHLSPVEDIHDKANKLRILNLQCAIDSSSQDYKAAFRTLQKLKSVKDSINIETLENQFTYYQIFFQTNKKKREIAEQRAQITRLELAKKKQQILWGSIIAAVLIISIVLYFIREKQLAAKKQQMQEEFSRKLLVAQEEERKRISRELHDGIGQSLILIKNKVRLKDKKGTRELVKQTLEDVRQVSRGLHPYVLENLGLTSAIEHLIKEAESNSDIFFDREIKDIDKLLPDEHKLNVYRIVQEAISNVLKHSGAEAAKVIVDKSDSFIDIKIIDHGKGFDLTSQEGILSSLGMQTLKERTKISGGKLLISSEKGSGTTIHLLIPYTNLHNS